MASGYIPATSSQMARASPVSDFSDSRRFCKGLVRVSDSSLGSCRTCWKGETAAAAPTRRDDMRSFMIAVLIRKRYTAVKELDGE